MGNIIIIHYHLNSGVPAYHNGCSIGKTLFSPSTAGAPSACPCVSVGSRWPYLSGSLLSGLQIRAGFLGCHCRARVQTDPHSRVQADCLLPLCCCQRRLADQRHHRVLTEAEQDWCPGWNNSVYQGKAAVLLQGIHLLLPATSFSCCLSSPDIFEAFVLPKDTLLPHNKLNCSAAFGPKPRVTVWHVPNDCSRLFAAVHCQLWEGEAGAETQQVSSSLHW